MLYSEPRSPGSDAKISLLNVIYLLAWWPRWRWAASWQCRHHLGETCHRWASLARGSRKPPWWGCSCPAPPRKASGTGRWAAPGTRAQRASRGRPECPGGSSYAPAEPSCWPAASPLPWSRAPADWAAASDCSPQCGRAAGRPGSPRTAGACRSCGRRCTCPSSSPGTRTLMLCTPTSALRSRPAETSSRALLRQNSCLLFFFQNERRPQCVSLTSWRSPKAQRRSVTESSQVYALCLRSSPLLFSVWHWNFEEVKALCMCRAWKQEEIVKGSPANQSASAPFGTLLSIKALNYPVCKNTAGACLVLFLLPGSCFLL